SSSALNVAATGLDCAINLPDSNHFRSELRAQLEIDARAVMADKQLHPEADDRSGLYQELIAAREAAGDEEGKHELTEEWSAFLDHEAATAKSPEARTVFDSHRLSAYFELGQPERAIPMLEESQRDFPGDYNPPARLALTYLEMKKYDDAIAAAGRALSLAYGPRRLGIWRTKIEALIGNGDDAGARTALETAIAEAEALPEEQRSKRTIAALKKRLEDLKTTAGTSGS
ncbi:MAG: tetratricopeptide repeat protein, partial [Thermoanaerobaculia bacterium]